MSGAVDKVSLTVPIPFPSDHVGSWVYSMSETNQRIIFRGRKIEVALREVRLHDGRIAERELVLHRGAVALVPMVDHDHVCLVRNERFAVGKTLLEVPAGTLDPGESADVTAARELKEETGYTAGKITKLSEWWVSPGYVTERMYLYLCEDLQAGELALEPDEKLKPEVVPWNEAVRMVSNGRIEDAKSMLAILICDRLRRNP